MSLHKISYYSSVAILAGIFFSSPSAMAQRNNVTLPGTINPGPVARDTTPTAPPFVTASEIPTLDPTLPTPPLPDGWQKILLNFLLTIHRTYMNSLGGPLFRGIQWAFHNLGISDRDHCRIVTAQLPTITGWRADLIRESMKMLEESQLQGIPQIIENLNMRPPFDENPRLAQAVGTVVGTNGVLECVLVSILDSKRLFLYAAFFGLNFLGFALLWSQLKVKLAAAYQLGAAFFIPPVLFAANVFVFYLFYQKEIDPVLAILRNFYPY